MERSTNFKWVNQLFLWTIFQFAMFDKSPEAFSIYPNGMIHVFSQIKSNIQDGENQ